MTIEDRGSIGSDEQQSSRPAEEAGTKKLRGRKPKHESRATEFRQRLIARRQMPEASRPSLRALAGELGTSHQLLSFYRQGPDKWLAREQVKRIRGRAEAEGRPMPFREHLHVMLISKTAEWIEELRKTARRGPLKSDQFKLLKQLVCQGLRGATEILAKCRQMTPEEERQARAAEKATMLAAAAVKHIERIKQEAERGPLPWRDIEILKILARRKCAGAKELLAKYSKSALPWPQVPQ